MVASQALASSWGKFGSTGRSPNILNHLEHKTSPRGIAGWEGEKSPATGNLHLWGTPPRL